MDERSALQNHSGKTLHWQRDFWHSFNAFNLMLPFSLEPNRFTKTHDKMDFKKGLKSYEKPEETSNGFYPTSIEREAECHFEHHLERRFTPKIRALN